MDNLFFWREQNNNQSHVRHERLEQEQGSDDLNFSDEDNNDNDGLVVVQAEDEDIETGGGGGGGGGNNSTNLNSTSSTAAANESTTNNNTSSEEGGEEEELQDVPELIDENTPGNENNTTTTTTATTTTTTTTTTLAELEEERELARRRTSICVLIAIFILFRLWIEALANANFTLLLLCLVTTSWTARWLRYNREREDELDERIAQYYNNNRNADTAATAEASLSELARRSDLPNLSFQAQLALAIMESQRQMMQGNFGNPDENNNRNNGISNEAQEKWDRYQYTTPSNADGDDDVAKEVSINLKTKKKKTKKKKGSSSYGSLSQQDDDDDEDLVDKAELGGGGKLGKVDKNDNEDLEDDDDERELPHCSICLCEYEDGDNVVRLPCDHVYHDDCVSSWTSNHVRCPLCNFDLESVVSGEDEEQQENSTTTSTTELSVV